MQTWWGCTLVTRSTSSFWSDTCSWALTNCIAHLRRRALICKACFTSQRQPTHLGRSMHNKTWAPGSNYSCSTECEWQGKEQTTIKLSLLPLTTYHSRAYASCGQHEHACKHTLDRLALNKLQLQAKLYVTVLVKTARLSPPARHAPSAGTGGHAVKPSASAMAGHAVESVPLPVLHLSVPTGISCAHE